MVMRLAESLDLTLRERNDLLISAGFAPAFPESPLDDAALRPIREALDGILNGHLPYPALVVRPHGILVTANRAFELFHEDVDPALLAPPVNLFRLALHPDGVAARVRNLPAWGRHITENLRAQLGRCRGGPCAPRPASSHLLAGQVAGCSIHDTSWSSSRPSSSWMSRERTSSCFDAFGGTGSRNVPRRTAAVRTSCSNGTPGTSRRPRGRRTANSTSRPCARRAPCAR